ncbi:uncharacterized protein LOC128681698 [Plodia interpunctella]|uniref:uncharacterized protein LOC128678463 n=1 Tax=Plodia interpunctella TaxID=58824 RepID=UPI0023684715|nr:uncharacterized protein LOC128671430 [Plodia interpunctella]XP_053616014.1 uncharacterized protein LOC128678463 [Plodia interpunctella]XP_053621782.1 uncharacterized protein LOC128681698 [Plodia interpunctella]
MGRTVAKSARGRSLTPRGKKSTGGDNEEVGEKTVISRSESLYFSDGESDGDSDGSIWLPDVMTTGKERGQASKRKASEDVEEAERASNKVSSATRGRAAHRGSYAGTAETKERLRDLSADYAQFERELEKAGTSRYLKASEKSGKRCLVDEHLEVVRAAAQKVLAEAGKSGNLKGTAWRAMNEACHDIIVAAGKIEAQCEESEAVRILRADNKRMREQLSLLEQETKALRTAFAERTSSALNEAQPAVGAPSLEDIRGLLSEWKESFERNMFLKLGGMVNDRLKEAEKRGFLAPEPIVRPPLAADKRKEAEPSAPKAGRSYAGAVAGATLMPPARPGPAPKATPAKKQPQQVTVQAQTPTGQSIEVPPPQEGEQGWAEVVKKGKKRGNKASPSAQPEPTLVKAPKASAQPPKKVKFAAPKTSAVVVTLKPESKLDYRTVISRATTIDLSSIGVDHVAAVRGTATGARIIEIPGANSGAAADSLAEKLREVIGTEAEVTRPFKAAQIRVSGFDEGVTPEALKDATARAGKCPPGQVKVGNIRISPDMTAAVIITCPVAAANALIDEGRLLVGWTAAKVRGLEALPMRCFRCMGIGHTRALCPSPVDRSELCHRCGKAGHISSACEASEPWCAVCYAHKLAAKHIMGGPSCNPPRTRGKLAPNKGTPEGTTMEH